MLNVETIKNTFSKGVILDFIKGIIIALALSLGLTVLFAFILKWVNISDAFIPAITLLIKGISILVGALVAVKGDAKGLIKGASFGEIYIIFAFLIFSVLSGGFEFSTSFVLDLIFSGLLGGIVGIVKVNRASNG